MVDTAGSVPCANNKAPRTCGRMNGIVSGVFRGSRTLNKGANFACILTNGSPRSAFDQAAARHCSSSSLTCKLPGGVDGTIDCIGVPTEQMPTFLKRALDRGVCGSKNIDSGWGGVVLVLTFL